MQFESVLPQVQLILFENGGWEASHGPSDAKREITQTAKKEAWEDVRGLQHEVSSEVGARLSGRRGGREGWQAASGETLSPRARGGQNEPVGLRSDASILAGRDLGYVETRPPPI